MGLANIGSRIIEAFSLAEKLNFLSPEQKREVKKGQLGRIVSDEIADEVYTQIRRAFDLAGNFSRPSARYKHYR